MDTMCIQLLKNMWSIGIVILSIHLSSLDPIQNVGCSEGGSGVRDLTIRINIIKSKHFHLLQPSIRKFVHSRSDTSIVV